MQRKSFDGEENNSTLVNIPLEPVEPRPSRQSNESASPPASFIRRFASNHSAKRETESFTSKKGSEQSPGTAAAAVAARILTPVLSRAREQHQMREAELEAQKENLSESTTASPDSDRIAAGNPVGFKAAAQAIQAMTHPVRRPKHKGGEGVRRLVESREHNSKFLGMNTEYWGLSLFSISGRAWPVLPQAIYCIYSTAMVAIIMCQVPNYSDIRELAGLQFPISTLGLALFLLLSFRTNSCYERWWEGRKLWEGIITKVQDIARISYGWVAPVEQEPASQLIRWALAFAYVAKAQLRVEDGYPELAGILSQQDIDDLEADIDPVALVLDKLTAQLRHCAVGSPATPPPIYSTLDNDIRGLNMDLAACQRILSCPMPWAYLQHLRSFMVLWLLGLPFAFVVTLGWWSILVTVVVGYELLGFETIGVEIENPFGRDYNDLPLDAIATELFVKMANVLGKLGQQVEAERLHEVICADPLHEELRTHLRHTGEFDYKKSSSLGEKETGMAQKVKNRLGKQGLFTSQPPSNYNGHDDGAAGV